MLRRPPRSTRTDTLLPYTTLFLSAQACDGHVSLDGRKPLFGPNLGSGIGRHGVQGIMLLTRAALGNAINAATGCKDEIADPRLGGKLAQPDGGIQIDSFGHFFETIAHQRSEARRVGKECVRTDSSRWSP